jgi:hypothetical protein
VPTPKGIDDDGDEVHGRAVFVGFCAAEFGKLWTRSDQHFCKGGGKMGNAGGQPISELTTFKMVGKKVPKATATINRQRYDTKKT